MMSGLAGLVPGSATTDAAAMPGAMPAATGSSESPEVTAKFAALMALLARPGSVKDGGPPSLPPGLAVGAAVVPTGAIRAHEALLAFVDRVATGSADVAGATALPIEATLVDAETPVLPGGASAATSAPIVPTASAGVDEFAEDGDATAAAPTPASTAISSAPATAAPAAASAAMLIAAAAAEPILAPAAGSAAIESVAPEAAADTLRPVRDLELLHPGLRIRVERVVARMKAEYGHHVEVVETSRAAGRHAELHAKGRTAPDESVTWTTESLHTEGRAADLVVDGDWSDPVAYERLQRIAREEGLATIGLRDAGHVEPHGDGRAHGASVARAVSARPLAEGMAAPERAAAADTASPTSDVARPSVAAAPARVATVATVALVADVAEPDRPHAAAPRTVEASASAVAHAAARPIEHVARTEESRPLDEELESSDSGPLDASGAEAEPRMHGTRDRAERPAASGLASRAERVGGPTVSDRLERIELMHDARKSSPLSSLTLRVEDEAGHDHRIRVDLRGDSVAADIAVSRASELSSLTRRLPDLATRLGEHGYEAASLHVRTLATDSSSGTSDQRLGREDRSDQQSQQQHPQHRHRARREREGDSQ